MRKGKTILALLLAAALLLTPAFAEGIQDKFPAVNSYADARYTDVEPGSWYTEAAQVCYETGLITGTDQGFSPQVILTNGQLAAIAARIRQTLTGEPIIAGTPLNGETVTWYTWYVKYLEDAGIPVPDPEAYSTRADFVAMLAAVTTSDLTPAINSIAALPDTQDLEVLRFYNAGLLTGVDAAGTFNGSGSLTRAEAAAMVARIVRPYLRKEFTPADPGEAPAQQPSPQPPSQSSGLSYEEELLQTTAISVYGHSIPFSEYVGWLNYIILVTDYNLYQQTGQRLNWDADYKEYGMEEDLESYFLDKAITVSVQQYLLRARAAELGCDPSDLAQVLNPSPTPAALSGYAESMGYFCAKHILIAFQDQATGQTIRTDEQAKSDADQIMAMLKANPTLDYFEDLIDTFNEDPGMAHYPNGYLFGEGEMVEEFEAATIACQVGTFYPLPVRTQFGYHIIWRLDPGASEDILAEYQEAMLQSAVESWTDTAMSTGVNLNQAMIDQLSVRGCYDAYLAQNRSA